MKKNIGDIFIIIDNNNLLFDLKLLFTIINDNNELLNYLDKLILNLYQKNNKFNIHINISCFNLKHITYSNLIINMAKIIYKYDRLLDYIYIYESNSKFDLIINLINNALGINIKNKIIFSTKKDYNVFINK